MAEKLVELFLGQYNANLKSRNFLVEKTTLQVVADGLTNNFLERKSSTLL
jgi:hypothetical protein